MTSTTTTKEELLSVPCEAEWFPLHRCGKGAPEAEDSCVRKGPGLPETERAEQKWGSWDWKLLPRVYTAVLMDILISFQDEPHGVTISLPDHTNQIGQDVGFCLRKNRLPVASISITCPGLAWSWGLPFWAPRGFAPPWAAGEATSSSERRRGPEKELRQRRLHSGPTHPHSVTVQPQPTWPNVPGTPFHLNRCGFEACKWHLLRR